MGIGRLILREIAYRKLNFSLGIAGVVIGVACLVAQVMLLRRHDVETERILAARESETRLMMQKLEDDIRKITVRMGFNVLILPKGQKVTDLYDEVEKVLFMPEDYAEKLARSRVATINHVLPSLTQRVKWPERQRKIMLMGVRGEVLIHSANQKPILEAVAPGRMVVGYELQRSLNLAVGQKVALMGREFVVSKLMEERGNWDDVTIWIDLKQAQEMLGRPGMINAILALECNCSSDRVAQIRSEIGALLPDTEVTEFATQAIARAEARNRAAAQATASLEQEKQGRAQLRRQRESFAAVLVPVVLLAAGVWIGLLALGNARDRRSEIGILRALGLGTGQIVAIFIGKAMAMGLAGACLGYLVGAAFAFWPSEGGGSGLSVAMAPSLVALVLVAAPLLAALASWIPAILAAGEDPAAILQEA